MAQIAQVGPLLGIGVALAGGCGGAGETRRAGSETGATDSAAVASRAGSAEGRVSNVLIGRRVGPGNRITEPTFQFAPHDTVHVSVGIEGGGGAEALTAAWRSPNGEILQQSSEQVGPAGENITFGLSQPRGLKPGTYKVIIFLGDDSVGTKAFVVQR